MCAMLRFTKSITPFKIIAIIVVSTSCLFSQWIDHGDYQDIKPSDADIVHFVTPVNDNYFYVLDDSLRYMIFDYNGYKLFSKIILL